MLYPSLIISILAAIVASQALITSTFQLLSQCMELSYFPQVKLVHTSSKFFGQVYIPIANWLLMIGTIIVTAVYENVSTRGLGVLSEDDADHCTRLRHSDWLTEFV